MSRVEPTCYGKAIDLLSRRGHFELEMRSKLRQRGFESEEIDTTVQRLTDEGLLDDGQAARQLVEERLRRGAFGARRLQQELQRRGIDADAARAVLAELVPEDDDAPAREAAERWLSRQSVKREPELLAAALGRYLERRGFSSRAIFGLLRQVRQGGVETTFESAP